MTHSHLTTCYQHLHSVITPIKSGQCVTSRVPHTRMVTHRTTLKCAENRPASCKCSFPPIQHSTSLPLLSAGAVALRVSKPLVTGKADAALARSPKSACIVSRVACHRCHASPVTGQVSILTACHAATSRVPSLLRCWESNMAQQSHFVIGNSCAVDKSTARADDGMFAVVKKNKK